MDWAERKYRAIGVLASWAPANIVALSLVFLFHIHSLIVAAIVAVLVALIGLGAGQAIGAEVYARRQRDEGWS